MIITKYNLETGCILGVIALQKASDAALQCQEGEGWIEDMGDPKTQMVTNGQLTSRPLDEIDTQDKLTASIRLRQVRDQLLRNSDWTQLPDTDLTPELKQDWATYRQELRDLMSSATDPRNIELPTTPRKVT